MLSKIALPSRIPTFAEFLSERQNSRQVPSPSKSAASIADLTWPSLYGNAQTQAEQQQLSKPGIGNDDQAFLGQYIHRIYCRECRDQENMAAANYQPSTSSGTGGGSGSGSPGSHPDSPPQYQMDQMSLADAMDANKEGMFSYQCTVRFLLTAMVSWSITAYLCYLC